MSCSCGCGSSCSCTPTVLDGESYANTLAARLGPTVDCARNLNTTMGLRPYQVCLIWTMWSGSRVGEGVEDVEKCLIMTPTPLVRDMSQIRLSARPVAVLEEGSVRVTEISTKYSEDLLLGRFDGYDLRADQSFYWEIRYPRPKCETVRRRFRVSGVPMYYASRFQWHVDLQKQSEDRDRAGEPRGV